MPDPLYRRLLLPGMGNMYSPSMGTAGWELLTKDEKRAWWGQADDLSKDYLRAALEQSRIQPKKLGAPHSEGPPSLLRSGYSTPVGSMPNTGSLLGPVDVPIDVQRPTEKIMTGPLRQAIEQEVLGTPGREPTIPPPGVAARDAQLFGVGELDVAMDQAMAGGVLGDELFQYGEEFEGIYQYLKSKGVPEGKIDEFWKRTINEMGDFEGKTIWKAEGTEDLINTQTGQVVQGLKDQKGRQRIYQAEYTGSQPTEEKMLKEKTQELIDEGMHPLDAEIEVREKGVMRRTPEQQAFAIDDPIVMGKAWQAKEGTPQYKVVTERAVEWAGQHGRGQWQTDDPRARVSTEHPRFTEFHRDRLAQLRAASQAEAKIGQTIALDPITGEPGFPGQKFFGLPGDLPDPIPDPLRGQSRPSGMEQFLRDINAQRAGADRFTYPRPRPGIETDLGAIIDNSLDIQIAGDAAGRRSQSLPATRAMLEGDVSPGRGGARIIRTPADQPSLPGMSGRERAAEEYIKITEEYEILRSRHRELLERYANAPTIDLELQKKIDVTIDQLEDLREAANDLALENQFSQVDKDRFHTLAEKNVRARQAVEPDMPFIPRGKRTAADYLAKNFTTDELHAFLKDLEASPSPYVSWGKEEIDQFARDVRAELARRSPTELAGPGELTGGTRPPTKPPPVATGGLGPGDWRNNPRIRAAYDEFWILIKQPGDQSVDELLKLADELRDAGVPFEKGIGGDIGGEGLPFVEEWDKANAGPNRLTAVEDQALRLQAKEQEAIQQADWERSQAEGMPPRDPPATPRAPAAGGADDFFPNNQSLNDAVNEFRAAGMTDEAAATFKAKALKKPKGWFPELTTWLRGKGGMGRASMLNLIDDVISTMRGTTLTLGQAATTPMVRPTGRIVTSEDIYLGQQEMQAGEDLIHQIDADKLDEIIDVGDLARTQVAAEPSLSPRTYGPEDYADNTLEPSTAEMRGAQAERTTVTGFEDVVEAGPTADVEPVETVAQKLTNKEHAIIKRDLDIMVDDGLMSAGERAKYLDDLAKGEVRIMEQMTLKQQKSLLRLMGETRKGHWAGYPERNAAYKKLLSSNTLGAWELTKQLVQANPSFRLSMKEAVGWGMTATEKAARGRGLITLGKNITGRSVVKGMNLAGRTARLATGLPGMLEMIVAGGQEAHEQFYGAGQTAGGGFRKPTPLQVNVADLDAEVARRLADPGNKFPWTRPHVLLEIAISHNLIPDKDARELVDILDGLMGLNPRSDRTKQIANTFNKKLAALLKNPAYEYDRLIGVVEDIPFQTKTDWINRVPILNWFTRPYLTAGAGGAEAPWWINWAKNPRSQSRSVEQVKIKASYANAMRSGHIPIELAVMVAPEMRYQRVKKDEGMSSLNWRLMEGVSIEHGGVPHVRKDVLHGILTEKPPGWVEGEPLGTLKISKEQAEEMMRHPQGRKLAADMQSGKIIPINPATSLPYRPRDYAGGEARYSPHRPTFDPNVGTSPPDYKWIQASDKYEDTFLSTLGYDRSIPTWREYDQWKAMRLGSEMRPGFTQPQFKQVEGGLSLGEFRLMQEAQEAVATPWGHPMATGNIKPSYTMSSFFEEFEDILDEMRASGVGVSEDGEGVETYHTNVSRRKIPNPLVPMYTGQEVKDGVPQTPRYSFTNDFDKSSRAYQTHKGIRQILPHTDPSYFKGGRELLKTGGGRY